MGRTKIIFIIAATIALITAVAAMLLCVVFKNKYADALNACADEFCLPRPLVRAVVWTESRFDRSAVSDKGAVGLMQLMPATLDDCAAALGIDNADGALPEVSLRCGCYYLKMLTDRFGETAALVAYNAGEKAAQRYLETGELYPETQGYLRSVRFARRLYAFFDSY